MIQSRTSRILSLDFLKGLIMVIMALDHTRHFFNNDAFIFSPTDPLQTDAFFFFTRWITHYCAPVFCFLAGISVYLVGRRKTKAELSSFLIKRGFWLVLMDLTIITFGWNFDIELGFISLLVMWSLGISMIILAAIIHLPFKGILVLSLVVIFGHNLLDDISIADNMFWSILHQRAAFVWGGGRVINVGYPIIPWFAVMSLGYWIGSYYKTTVEPVRRQKLFVWVGAASIVLFLIIRGMNGYGNFTPWKLYDTLPQMIFSFLNPAKYPPSLTYLLMTLGPTFLFLGTSERLKGTAVDFFSIFGKVPLFYYVIHIYVIHVLAMVSLVCFGYDWELMIFKNGRVANHLELMGTGYSLGAVYLIWVLIILLLYPLCKKYSYYKATNKDKSWTSYL